MTLREEQSKQQEALRKALEDNTIEIIAFRIAMVEHNAKQQLFESLVAKHESALYGDGTGTRKGYLQKFDDLEYMVGRAAKGIEKGLWAIAIAIGSGIGIWVWDIFKSGLTK
jgi:hypothetical protein